MDILGIGSPELIFILFITLILFGPRRLVEIAIGLGKIIRTVRQVSQDFMAAWQQEVNKVTHLEELHEARQELEEVVQELRQAQLDVTTELPGIQAGSPTKEGIEIRGK